MVTDKLARYVSAIERVLTQTEHRRHKPLNKRAENSHRPFASASALAAIVNPIDWQRRDALVKAFICVGLPVILGCDLAGVLVEVGRQSWRLGVGDQVLVMMPHDWGAQAELVAIPEELVVRRPAGLSMGEAVSVAGRLGDIGP